MNGSLEALRAVVSREGAPNEEFTNRRDKKKERLMDPFRSDEYRI